VPNFVVLNLLIHPERVKDCSLPLLKASGVTKGGRGRTAPGDTTEGGDSDLPDT